MSQDIIGNGVQSAIPRQSIAAAPSSGEIVQGLHAINSIIDTLESHAVRLTNRLDPVIRPPEPANSTAGADIDSMPLSPFAQELQRIYRRIDSLNNLVADTDYRLELP